MQSDSKWLRNSLLERIKICISVMGVFLCPFRASLQNPIVEFKKMVENLWVFSAM